MITNEEQTRIFIKMGEFNNRLTKDTKPGHSEDTSEESSGWL